MISPGFFFFFSILISWVVCGVKGQKWPKLIQKGQNHKKVCLLCSISQEPFIIWFSLMVHMFKMIIFPDFFFHFFRILIFQVVGNARGRKMAQNDKKLFLSCPISQEPYIILSSCMVHMCKRISPGICYIFPNFSFQGC